jgi:integrase
MQTNEISDITRIGVLAAQALWNIADDGRADCTHDRRFRALALLATFASLRWREATALTRADLDLRARTVRIKAAYVERSTGELLLGPPESRAGRRIIGILAAIIPDLRDQSATYVKDEPGALVFPGAKGGPMRRGNFNKMSAWPHAVESIGMPELHFHDLRHRATRSPPRARRVSKTSWAHGPRFRAGRDDLPAQGARRGQGNNQRDRRTRQRRAASRRRGRRRRHERGADPRRLTANDR